MKLFINLFCDASIDPNTKTACGGTYATTQDENNIGTIGISGYIQEQATNNSAEILAVWTGVTQAISLQRDYPNAVFRLFSDSKISIYGVRDWVADWIRKMRHDGTLISSSGKPVANQQRFIDVFNIIVEHRFPIEFYHQRGHVSDGRVSISEARRNFISTNKCTPEMLGLSMEFLCDCNNVIDNYTRDAIYAYLDQNVLKPGIFLEGMHPMEYKIRAGMIGQYMRLIDKKSIAKSSRHDFKGGFNQ